MPNTTNENGNPTPRASHLSPTSTSASTLSPTWRPPKTPLAPHRLAKLANALGVSTPAPAGAPYLSRSFSESASTVDHARRSPTPSSAMSSSMGFSSHSNTPQTSKFLLHVIPPLHLPHDSNTGDDTKTVPPPNTPGYHTQFRRGTLVPVHSTLQAQLGAIAREYALPSSAGLILYLVTTPAPQSPALQSFDAMDEPGPRLSEDIWKHLWTRVLRTEQRDDGLLMPSRSPTPQTPHTPRSPLMLRLAPAARSTPFLPQEQAAHPRPFISSSAEPVPPPHAPQATYPTTTAPSTPTSVSDRQSNNKSAPPSSTSVSQSEPGTPDTSVEDVGLRANFLDLPGLNSPSLIPILAKVEFDIDRRKAAWYEPWVRSRKANHAKRAESRKGNRRQESGSGDEPAPREHVPIELLTGKKKRDDPFGLLADTKTEPQGHEGGYARLSESPDDINSDSDSDIEDLGEDATARVSAGLVGSKDPLGDVFGTDADAWAEIRAESGPPHKYDNPNVVNLALTAAELDMLPSEEFVDHDDDTKSTKEEDEVFEMLDMMGKPNLVVSIPSAAKDPIKRSSSPSVNGSRKIPPPLVLKSKDKAVEPPVALNGRDPSVDSPRLAYLGGMSDHAGSDPDNDDADEVGDYRTRLRNPTESDKRVGAVFDDLDLGLELTEDFDDNDPNDRRRSQYLMSAQLDAIEKTMASLSPRFMTTSLEEEQNLSFNSATLSPSTPANMTLSPGRSFDFLPPLSPRLPQHPDPEEEPSLVGQSWPAVPFASIKDRDALPAKDAPPSPPRLALNGVSTSAPKSYMPTARNMESGPTESERRKKELEDEEALYNPSNFKKENNSPMESPIIPLSPDPFGRHPSTPDPPAFQGSGAQWDTMTIGKGQTLPEQSTSPLVQGRARSNTTTSRFSADSLKGEPEPAVTVAAVKTSNRATLISVKSIKKLWRKSNKSSNAGPVEPVPPLSTSASGKSSTTVPLRPERPSEEQLYLPDVTDVPLPANFGRLSPNVPPPPPKSQDQLYPGRRSIDQQGGPAQQPANVGRLSPMMPPSPHLPSQEQLFAPRRPSLDQHNLPPSVPANVGRLSPQLMPPPMSSRSPDQVPSGSRPSLEKQGRRPSQDQQFMPPPPPRQQSLDQFAPQQQQYPQSQPYFPPQQQQQFQQLSIPSYPGRNPNSGPIITPYMKASKAASNLDRLHFDQESPYPTHRSSSIKQSPRPPSPPALPAIPEQEKAPDQEINGGRKSILRWKSAASTSSNSSTHSEPQPRASLDRSNTNSSGGTGGTGARRASIVNYGSTRTSVTTPELPPSPQIPGQFVKNGGLDHRTSQRSKLTTSSTDSSYSPPQRQISLGARSVSPQRSMASSRDSQGSRPSFDTSGFEFVSPKADMLSYPYNTPDQE